MTDALLREYFTRLCLVDVLLRVSSNSCIYSMSSKKKRKSPCPFASAKKPSKRKKGSISFHVLAASDQGSCFKQEKLIALDEARTKSMGE